MNFKEVQKRWEQDCRGEPETAILIYILGTLLYEKDQIEGEAVCALTLPKNKLIEDKNFLNNYRLIKEELQILKKLQSNPKIIRSFITNIENPKLFLRKKEVARLRAKVFIKSKLKNVPTSIYLIKEDRYWKILNAHEFLLENTFEKE
ncbi:MAG: hypothetical protein ACTSO9_20095 [Candidatus Helarchaeota archaeon]